MVELCTLVKSNSKTTEGLTQNNYDNCMDNRASQKGTRCRTLGNTLVRKQGTEET